MVVTVNGKRLDGLPDDQLQALEALAGALARSGLAVHSIRVDGMQGPATLQDLLSYPRPIRELALELSTLEALIEEVRETAQTYLPRLQAALESCAHDLQQGREAAALARLVEATDGLEWYAGVTAPLRALAEGGHAMPDVHRHLIDLNAALENRDLVLVADILAYDVVPGIQRWLEFLASRE